VIHSGRAVMGFFDRHADKLAKVVHSPVDAVAEAHGLHLGCDDGCPPDVHGHRVRVVEQQGIRAVATDVGGEVAENRKGAQGAEDSANPRGIADGLDEAVACWDLEVDAGGRDAADLDRVDHEVGALESRPSIQCRGDRRSGAQSLIDLSCRALRDGEPLRVHIMKHYRNVVEFDEAEQIGHELAGEHHAARPDESNRCHTAIIDLDDRNAQGSPHILVKLCRITD
jgi:hypothetical protein